VTRFNATVVNGFWGHETDAGVSVLMVVPVKELPGEVPGVFDRVEPFGESGAVFEGLELRLRTDCRWRYRVWNGSW